MFDTLRDPAPTTRRRLRSACGHASYLTAIAAVVLDLRGAHNAGEAALVLFVGLISATVLLRPNVSEMMLERARQQGYFEGFRASQRERSGSRSGGAGLCAPQQLFEQRRVRQGAEYVS